MARAEVILSEKLLLFVFRCFTNKMMLFGVIFWLVKNKAINFNFQNF